jgi:3-deoxy-manno-octulosonate cytidylyltransferase (CMP-KDO synthetase)
MNDFRVVIPARLESTRLPGKVLLDLCGKPMVQHVWERAQESDALEVVVATDSERVAEVAAAFGADVCMTSAECSSGTDRVGEVCMQRDWSNEQPVVNVQGDAPLVSPASIRSVAQMLVDNPDAAMATLCVPLTNRAEYLDPNVVKVTFSDTGRALYFSRSPIPAHVQTSAVDSPVLAWRHLGLYGYRVAALQMISATAPCELELSERLEQLRALWMGLEIRIAVDTGAAAPDVDTADELEAVASLMRSQSGV